MQVVVVKKECLYKYPFPSELVSSYWVKDNDEFGNERELVMLEKANNMWQLVANEKCHIIVDNNEVPSVVVSYNKFYLLKIEGKETTTSALIYVCNETAESYESYQVKADGDYTIGYAKNQNIVFNTDMVKEEHAILTRKNNAFYIKALDNDIGIYINDHREVNKKLSNGDIIFVVGYKMIILNDIIIINKYTNGVTINSENIVPVELPKYQGELLKTEDDDDAELYSENDYFSRSPRFVTTIGDEEMKIDNPPGKSEPDDTPVIYTIGPMLTMAMSSVVSASTSITNVVKGNGTLWTVLPKGVISVAMLVSYFLWTSLIRRYSKKILAEK